MNCFLFFLFDAVMTALTLGGVVVIGGKGTLDFEAFKIVLPAGLAFLVGIWVAFFVLC